MTIPDEQIQQQDTREILRKVRRVEISTRAIVRDLFSGEYHSVFKGRGMDFAEVREYIQGDDIRQIDWNVTARMGHPYVKVFQEERELTVILAVDISASENFGAAGPLKRELITEICAVLAFSAIRNNDKVGLLLFSDRIEKFIPPDKGNSHILTIIRHLLYWRPQGRGTDIGGSLQHLNRLLKKRGIVFLVSDFLAADFEKPLRILRKRHDVIALAVSDPWEETLPGHGFLRLEDLEAGKHAWLHAGSRRLRRGFKREREEWHLQFQLACQRSRVDVIEVSTAASYIKPIIRFFKQRAGRR